ncbi:hypothetical protein ICW40_08140 [Actinotalea ferrariae]|uniref:hypothetical protein n=1 Tax=Actinotalea ferrariae TaxID=1386098 RepID=UPI001C8BEAA0|nr:hypothetical protein [Actinotalea ferrariae]MBX9244778.1 hypothetical protein [Actinotalea ferrariae]
MARTTTARRRMARSLAIATLTATALGGALAAPASAAQSPAYSTMSQCRDAQRAYGASSFVRISKSCYSFIYEIAPGIYDPNPYYRFNYVTRY